MSRRKVGLRSVLSVTQAAALLLSFTGQPLADDAVAFTQALEPKAIRSAFQDATAGRSKRPKLLDLAFVVAEDPDFLDEFPAWSNLTATITRWYPPRSDERSIKRHLMKLQTAVAIADTLDHDEILAWYMTGLYFGRGCYGVEAASLAYFGVPTEQLSLDQVALLAALPAAPATFDPGRRPDRALERRNLLITEMVEAGAVTQAIGHVAAAKPLRVIDPVGKCGD